MHNKYLESSSTFSLFSEKELVHQKYIQELNIIVEKYNILQDENQLIGSTDKTFLYLINYVLDLKEQNISIPKDIEKLFFTNLFLKEQLNSFFEKELENITKNSSMLFFKGINTVFTILCMGTNEKFLDENLDYDLESISTVFRFYEALLKSLCESNKELFYLTFDSYTILFKAFIQLSKIYSLDIVKAKSISSIFELITETISRVKFTVVLNDTQLRKLSSIQGKYLFYFSHLDDISIQENDVHKSIEKYFLCFEKQVIGYTLFQDNLSSQESSKSNEFLIHKNLSSILILELLNKLEEIFFNKEYLNKDFFQNIYRLYYKTFYDFQKRIASKEDIEDFKKDLLNSLFHNYNINLQYVKNLDHHAIINDFIISEKSFENKNLETIYNLLHFAKDIEDFKYLSVAEILSDSKAIENEYDEFYKLSIFSLVINKKFEEKHTYQKLKLFKKIYTYLKENEMRNHLESIYNKLLLDLEVFDLSNENEESEEKDYKNKIQNVVHSYLSDDDFELNY